MKLTALLLVAFLVAIHAKSHTIPDPMETLFSGGTLPGNDWKLKGRSDPKDYHTVTFAASPTSGASPTCDAQVKTMSAPNSPTFGNFYSMSQINSMFSNPEATKRIENFLQKRGYPTVTRGDFVSIAGPISRLESLIGAKFFSFYSKTVKKVIYRTTSYVVPEEISPYVDFIANTVSFPGPKTKVVSHAVPYGGRVTPKIINDLYNIKNTVSNPLSSASVFEAIGQSYDPQDLTAFQTQNGIVIKPVDYLIGPNNPQSCTKIENCSEGSLDIQYLMAVAQNATTVYWSIDSDSQDPFLDWIVAVSSTVRPPLVHSISYGALESSVPLEQMQRFNLEACKLALRGVTIVVSSGDDGAGNYNARDDLKQCGFNPSFPASSPYVLSVGATQGPESGYNKEVACGAETGGQISTGGGFSWTFKTPQWQYQSVQDYLFGSNNVTIPSTSSFASTGRGYPDVAALGHGYSVIIGGKSISLSGTSASTPVIAGMLTLVNSERMNAGKSPLGFVNPLMYYLARIRPDVFNDVTEGNNRCMTSTPDKPICCPIGFEASKGWDPLTGLGSINFDKLRDVLLRM